MTPAPLPPSTMPPPAARYGVALLVGAAAVSLTYLLRAFLDPGVFLFFYPAVVVAAWYGGFGPGVLVAVGGVLVAEFLFLEPVGTFQVDDPAHVIFILMFIGLAAVVTLLIARTHAAKLQAEAQAASARSLAAQLAEQSAVLDGHARALEARAGELEQAMAAADAARQEAEAAYARSEVERRRVSILAETSRALSESREYQQRLRALAQLVTRELADYCVMDVLEEGGTVQRVAAAARDPSRQQLISQSLQWPPRLDQDSAVARVLRTGEPEVVLDVTEGWRLAASASPEHARHMKQLGITSIIIMPLAVADRRLGALSVIRAAGSEPFEEADVELVRVLATRAALLIELARLFHDAQQELERRQQLEATLRDKSVRLEALNLAQERMLEQLQERTAQAELAEHAARDASQAKSQFLAVMSHELRTPLNAIMGYTDLLQSGATGARLAEREQGFLDRIRVSVLHLRGLIDEVLSLARIEAGREELALERVSLAGLLEDTAHMIHAQALEKHLSVRVRTEGDVIVTTDPGKVRQILVNLASNAVKFTDAGWVTLALQTGDGSAELEVSDTGIGIAPEHRERIFEPFTQVDQSRTRRAGGSGLGLSVSRRLALLLGGELRFEPISDGGSRFVLTLPLTEIPAPAGSPAGLSPR